MSQKNSTFSLHKSQLELPVLYPWNYPVDYPGIERPKFSPVRNPFLFYRVLLPGIVVCYYRVPSKIRTGNPGNLFSHLKPIRKNPYKYREHFTFLKESSHPLFLWIPAFSRSLFHIAGHRYTWCGQTVPCSSHSKEARL